MHIQKWVRRTLSNESIERNFYLPSRRVRSADFMECESVESKSFYEVASLIIIGGMACCVKVVPDNINKSFDKILDQVKEGINPE